MDFNRVQQITAARLSRAPHRSQMLITVQRQYFDSEQGNINHPCQRREPKALDEGKQKMSTISQSRAIRKTEAKLMQAKQHIIEL